MDMLFKRYACPFVMLDEMIAYSRLHDFIIHIAKTINQENKEKVQWEYFLHKVYDKSYTEFIEGIEPPSEIEEETEAPDLETTIKEQIDIFNIELV